ncbi:MAG TPA: putative Ig domain-containing protein, partial [Ilumatobacteraceae bacterium]
MIGGVVVAALITSLNVSRSTSIQVKDSTDAGLITAYLTRDAQSTGGIVPTTAIRDSTVGVSTAPTGWDGCAQVAPATLVVRFSWIERTTLLAPSSKVVVTYAFDSSKAQLTRRSCRDSTTGPDIVLGRDVVSVVATCDSDCTVAPTTVSLAVTGSGTRAPLSYTLKASLRMDAQAVPTAVNAAPVPLVALGAGAAVSCPNVDLAGTGPVTVVGNAVVDSLCGSTPVRDTSVPALLRPTGATTAIAGVVNPFIARVKPVFTCNPAGLNPAVFGQSASASTIVVYPQSVKITADTVFQPGVYVFCKGLELTSNRVTGSNVLFYIESGSFEAKAAATVDLTGRAASDPTLQKMLVWSAATNVPVTIAGGPRVSNYRGFVYAPNAKIVASSSVGLNVEGLNAQGLTVTGTGQARLGPIPTITVTPTALANGQTNLAYSATMVATGGTAPYTWSATGLPAGLAISAGGVISGTPTAAGTYAFLATAFDATKAAASADVTVTIVAALAISTPSLPNGQVGVAYATTTLAATGGTPPYTWAASGLPPGLALNGSTIAGTPTVPGTYNVVVTATDSSAASVQATYSVTISLPTCAVTAPPWKGQYYPTTTLSGTPVLRDDANINFNWGAGVPIAGIAADNYSVRWTRTTTFAAGNYTFTLDTDD